MAQPFLKRRWLRRVAWLAACCVVAVAGVAWWLGGELVASANRQVVWPADFPVQQVSIAGDGHSIAGSWRDLGADSPVVLLLHGIRADRTSMLPHARLLVQSGFSVLLIDLQAHGETPGEHITLGWREAADVRAARDWIRVHAPGRRVGAVGTSLGGAAILLGQQPAGFDAVVLESVYPRLRRAVENRVRMRLGAIAPWLTPMLLAQVQPRLKVSVDQLEPVRGIAALGAPVLVVGGSEDRHTTKEETLDLYRAARAPSSVWIAEGAAHQDLARFNEQEYEDHVVRFLDAQLGKSTRPVDESQQASAN